MNLRKYFRSVSHDPKAKFCKRCGRELRDRILSSEYDDQTGKLISQRTIKECPNCDEKGDSCPW